MKVRAKFGTPTQYEVLEESNNYYVINNINIAGSSVWAAPKSHYEPVPVEPVWRDVTAECVVVGWDRGTAHQLVHTRDTMRIRMLVSSENGYRLRKVNLLNPGDGLGTHHGQWAFIVEKCDAE